MYSSVNGKVVPHVLLVLFKHLHSLPHPTGVINTLTFHVLNAVLWNSLLIFVLTGCALRKGPDGRRVKGFVRLVILSTPGET